MNVNPFSYLIEKLKGKVDKSGDTMSGGLKVTAGGLEVCGRVYNSGDDEGIVVKPAPNNLAGLILGSNNGKRSVFYCRTAAATAPEWNYCDENNNTSVIYHPAKSGTIALTSDLPTTSSEVLGSTVIRRYGRLRTLSAMGGMVSGITSVTLISSDRPIERVTSAVEVYANDNTTFIGNGFVKIGSDGTVSLTVNGTAPSNTNRCYFTAVWIV